MNAGFNLAVGTKPWTVHFNDRLIIETRSRITHADFWLRSYLIDSQCQPLGAPRFGSSVRFACASCCSRPQAAWNSYEPGAKLALPRGRSPSHDAQYKLWRSSNRDAP